MDFLFANSELTDITNVCENLCKLCAFGRKAEDPGSHTLSLDELEAKAKECHGLKVSEIHIVGGLNPALKIDYYVEMLRRICSAAPGAIIKAFTAVEIDYLAKINAMSLDEVFKVLKDAGLDSLPGGGADDLDGTVMEEKIAHDAVAATAQIMAKNKLIHLIKAAGKQPIERDTLYNVVGEGF